MNSLLITAILEFMAIFLALIYLLQIHIDLKQVIAMIVTIVLPTILVYIWGAEWIGIVTLFVTTTVVFYYFSKKLRVLFDVCYVFISGILADHGAQFVSEHVPYRHDLLKDISYFIFFMIFFVVLIYIFSKVLDTFINVIGISISVQLLVFTIVIMTIVVFYMNSFIPTTKDEMALVKFNLSIQIGYVLLMSLVFSFLYRTLKMNMQVERRTLEVEQFTQYMQALEEVNRDMNKFRHDYANILLTMQGYLDDDDVDGLRHYFQQYIVKTEQHTLFKQKVLGNLDNLQVVGLKGLLATKALQADEYEIAIQIEIPDVIYEIPMDMIDLSRIIGILMDNAIEASKEQVQGSIHLAVFNSSSGSVVLIIRNFIGEKSVNISQLFNERFSTKGAGRGMGLTTVKQIVQHYPNVTMNTQIDGQWFVQQLNIRQEGHKT